MATVRSFNRKKDHGWTFVIACWLFTLAFAGGWIANIVKLVGAQALEGMEIARIAGIFVAPLGSVLGFL